MGGTWWARLRALHRDEEGGLLEYGMVFAFIALPLIFLFDKLFDVLSDYFGMMAFFVTWPFI
ncbi:MAG: hypothetical protein ISS74_01955 [Planctomycetes bacterium]|nr:hypothetical protein [Planctomycetota bacterium]